MLTYKTGRKEDNYRPVHLILVTGKVVELIILSTNKQQVQGNQEVRTGQHGFMKGRSYLMKPIFFCYKMTCPVDEGKAVDAVYLDVTKAFLLHLPQHSAGESGCSWLGWVFSMLGLSWMYIQAPRGGVNGVTSR